MLNIAVFASGRGSNTRAILENIEQSGIPARISVIISNKPDAGIFDIARECEIEYHYLNPLEFSSDDNYSKAVMAVLDEHNVSLIVLAGYLKKIPSTIISEYRNRIMNIHPALLPAFGGKGMYGIHVHRAVIEYGAKISGVTVHFVDEDYDHGPIILQKAVEVYDDDTPESLSNRILKIEHIAYSEAIKLFAEDRLAIENRHVYIINKGK